MRDKARDTDISSLAESIPHLVWVADRDGTIRYFNERWRSYTGLTVERVHGEGTPGVVHPDDLEEMWTRWRHSVATEEPFEYEYRLRSACDGSYRWFLVRAELVHDDAGAARWIGTATDIDAQKRATENLRFILDATKIFSSSERIEAVCEEFARLAVQRFADWCFVTLTGAGKNYEIAAIAHRDHAKAGEIEAYLATYPLHENEVFISALMQSEPTLVRFIVDQAIVAPLRDHDVVLGAIVMGPTESRRHFGREDGEVMRMLAELAADQIGSTQTLTHVQRQKRRLQFVSDATQAIYESFDLTATLGDLARTLVNEIGDFVVMVRIEGEHGTRVIAAAHRDPEKEEIVHTLVGVRTLNVDAERRFVHALERRKPIIRENLDPARVAQSMWPYLSKEVLALSPRSVIVIPLHSRGAVYGAIMLYDTDPQKHFSEAEIDVLSEIGRHASVAIENVEVFERERRMAETLQDSLLPPSLPDAPGLHFDVVYLPGASGAHVGGDWYDAFRLEDGCVVVSAGDVTGRGADAAVIMGKMRNLLAIAPSYERDPARILDTVESVLMRSYPNAIVTAFLGIMDSKRESMRYANAGHPYPLLRRQDEVEELHAEGVPVGLRRTVAPAPSCSVDLRGARMLVLYTDGLVEAYHDVIGGYRRLREVVERDAVLHTHRPAQFIEASCLDGVAEDDVAVLTVSFDRSLRWSFDAENAKAAQDARGEFVEYLRANAEGAESIAEAELIFGELVGNVVRHAPGAIDVDLEWTDVHPVLHVIDRGPAFRADPELPADLLSEGGRGLFLVRQMGTSMRVEHVPAFGNHVAVELALGRRKAE